MSERSTKDRVYSAAEQVSADRTPTVSAVREIAGVSNADASRYLKEWKEERLAAGTRIAAAPASVTEIAVRMAGAAWTEAASLADARHAEVEAAWRDERKQKDRDLHELALELDQLTKTQKQERAAARAEIESAARELEQRAGTIGELQKKLDTATSAAATLATELAKAQAQIETLQSTQTAILARISPPALPEDKAPKTT